MKRGNFTACFCIAMASILGLGAAPARARDGAALVSDRNDYLPGETVILTGTGFDPDEQIDLSLSIDDPEGGLHIADYAWERFYADPDGGFFESYIVPEEAAGMTLTATALGLESGRVATATFTDSVVAGPALISPTTGHPVSVPSSGGKVDITYSYTTTNILGNTTERNITIHLPNPVTTEFALVSGGVQTRTDTLTIPAGTPVGAYDVTIELRTNSGGFNRNASLRFKGVVVVIAACTATNTPPVLSASDYSLGDVCPPDGSFLKTVTPSNFGAAANDPDLDPTFPVTFSDGTTSKDVLLTPDSPSATLTLTVTDDPSWRDQSGCDPLQAHTTLKSVVVSASVHNEPANAAPSVTGDDLILGEFCEGSLDVTALTPADFNAGGFDPDGDPFVLSLSPADMTLMLAEGLSDGEVGVPVVLTATDDPSGRDDQCCAPLASMSGDTTVYVRAILHRNHAPSISASDFLVGDVVGGLSGGKFGTTVHISPSNFNPILTDADGDPISVSASAGVVTLNGPGPAEVEVVLTATDDPAARTAGLCGPMSSSTTVKVRARIVYDVVAFLSPLAPGKATIVKQGSAVPLKFILRDCNGTLVTSDLGTPHRAKVVLSQAACPDGDPTIDDAGNSGDDGDAFRWANGIWIFNLKTNKTYTPGSTYSVRAILNDGRTLGLDGGDGVGAPTFISIK